MAKNRISEMRRSLSTPWSTFHEASTRPFYDGSTAGSEQAAFYVDDDWHGSGR